MREINQTRYSRVSIDDINRQVATNPRELIDQSELYYRSQLHMVADKITQENYKVVLLAGPSASGKTTTAHKLKHRIRELGYGAKVLSMDDFFKGIEHYPLREDGTPDMESIEALDIEQLNQCFHELLTVGKSEFPIFDFTKQAPSKETRTVELGEHSVLIMEGIHALNPRILQNLAQKDVFHMYVSVRTKFMAGEEEILKPSEIRLIRRMVRDYLFRNYPPEQTIEYWDHVVASEKINIDPYRDDVDFKMDTTIDYEVCVWKSILFQLFSFVSQEHFKKYPEMQRINRGLSVFDPVNVEKIPEDSLLREFIGKEQ